MNIRCTLFIACFLFGVSSHSEPLITNSLKISNGPKWISIGKIKGVTNKIESKLEWKIRRVPVIWHHSHSTYSKVHSLGPMAAAVTLKSKSLTEIHIGPSVTKDDYLEVLGHEMVHVIFYQKYKSSIPSWLEEGFANFYSRKNKINYSWLAKQKRPKDITKMKHAFSGESGISVTAHYKFSQALVEMLDKKCDLQNLLRLSVKKKLETYIKNSCEIKDINLAFNQWIVGKSKVK